MVCRVYADEQNTPPFLPDRSLRVFMKITSCDSSCLSFRCWLAVVMMSGSLTTVPLVRAADYDIAADGNWSAGATWNPNVTGGPVETDNVVITNIAAARTVTFTGAKDLVFTINSLSYDETDNVTIRNNGSDNKFLVINNNLVKNGSGTLHFSQATNSSFLNFNIKGDLLINAGAFNLGLSNNGFGVFKVDGATTLASGATIAIGVHYAGVTSFDFGTTTINGSLTIGDASRSGKANATKYNGLSGGGAILAVDGNDATARIHTMQFAQSTGSAVFSGNISQGTTFHSIELNHTGAGRQALTGTLSYTGTTRISGGGVLQFGNNTSTQVGTGHLTMSGGTELNGGSILGLGNSSGVFTRTVTTSAGTNTMQMSGFAGFAAYGIDQTVTLNGGAALTWNSTGFLTSNGTLVFGDATANRKVTITNNISLNAVDRTILVHRGTGAVDGAISGVIDRGASGAAKLTKTGGGVLELSGANIYTGLTTISAGTLLVTNTTGSGTGTGAVSVAAGATLGGSGIITGLVTTIGSTSVIMPSVVVADATPSLRLNGGLNAAAGANFQFALGTNSDALTIGGTFTGSTASGALVVDFSDAGGIAAGVSYTLINFGTTSGLAVADFTLSATSISSGFVLDNTFGTGGFLLDSDSLEVRFSAVPAAVPEPSTYAVLAGIAAVAFVAHRRRVKQA